MQLWKKEQQLRWDFIFQGKAVTASNLSEYTINLIGCYFVSIS